MSKIFFIAEAGVNHNGDLSIAKEMIDIAQQCGADAVKFQTFKAQDVMTKNAPKANYQKKMTHQAESQLEMVKKFELSKEEHQELYDYCTKKNIIFLSSPFDLSSIDFLEDLGIDTFKIPSGEITNYPYLKKIGALKKNVIISTGMSNYGEIEAALNILVKEGTKKENIIVLHCNTEYPSPIEDVNLLAMVTIKNTFKVNVGFSDHTDGIEVAIAAAALGAKVIEKHFTLDKGMAGPDQKGSADPQELRMMISGIRKIEKALGDGIKKCSKSELVNKPIARKSIVAKINIKKGGQFCDANICVKRPGTGITAMDWDHVMGSFAKRDFVQDELIEL